jgi:hypothetical protein
MANEMTGKFVLKLFEKTGDKEGVRFFDRYEIGQEVALLDKINLTILWIFLPAMVL